MKPSAQLLYTYQQAREQALEECRLRQEAVYARFPRLREITEARKALTYQLGRSLLAQEDPQSTRKAYAANMQTLLREERALLKENNIPPPSWSLYGGATHARIPATLPEKTGSSACAPA